MIGALARNAAAAAVLIVLTLLVLPLLLAGLIFGWREAFLVYATWMMKVGRRILGIDVRAEGLQRLDRTRPYVFMGNHQSFLDGPLLATVADRPLRFIVKRFVLRIPVLGLGMAFAGYVPLDREGVGEGRRRMALAARLIRQRGYSYLIFPEGTRSWDGKLQRLRRGGFYLALEAGANIVPVSVRGSHELLPRGSRLIHGGPVRIVFHEPIDVSGYGPGTMPRLMERVRAALASGLD